MQRQNGFAFVWFFFLSRFIFFFFALKHITLRLFNVLHFPHNHCHLFNYTCASKNWFRFYLISIYFSFFFYPRLSIVYMFDPLQSLSHLCVDFLFVPIHNSQYKIQNTKWEYAHSTCFFVVVLNIKFLSNFLVCIGIILYSNAFISFKFNMKIVYRIYRSIHIISRLDDDLYAWIL